MVLVEQLSEPKRTAAHIPVGRLNNAQNNQMKDKLLIADAVINLILGILLLLIIPFPDQMTAFFGVPRVEHPFYPSIMGGIFVGIGISLMIERHRKKTDQNVGLGLAGAVTINLCGGIVLIGWLWFGSLNIPLHGKIFLWSIAILLITISSIEFRAQRKNDISSQT